MARPAKTWDLTLNNYTDADITLLNTWTTEVRRMVVSREIGERGTPHLQGRITFARAYRLAGLKKLHDRAHWEPTLATADSLYPMKAGSDVIINVDTRKQGTRNDLHEIADAIKAGATKHDLWQTHTTTMIRYHRGVDEALNALRPAWEVPAFSLADFPWTPFTSWSSSHVLWGPAGCGKTQFALAHFAQPLLVSHADMLKAFNPSVHDGIVFDDMNFKHWPREAQIHIVDTQNTRGINVKNGCVIIPPQTRKIFTTNIENGECVALTDPAIARRVTVTEVGER